MIQVAPSSCLPMWFQSLHATEHIWSKAPHMFPAPFWCLYYPQHPLVPITHLLAWQYDPSPPVPIFMKSLAPKWIQTLLCYSYDSRHLHDDPSIPWCLYDPRSTPCDPRQPLEPIIIILETPPLWTQAIPVLYMTPSMPQMSIWSKTLRSSGMSWIISGTSGVTVLWSVWCHIWAKRCLGSYHQQRGAWDLMHTWALPGIILAPWWGGGQWTCRTHAQSACMGL